MSEGNQQPRYSYSALSLAEQCMRSFYEKYVLKHRVDDDTLALSMGSLLHKIKELISLELMNGNSPDYNQMKYITEHGWEGRSKLLDGTDSNEKLLGVIELKQKFSDEWMKPDTKSGMTYEQKLEIFYDHLGEEEADKEWKTIGAEVPFSFMYGDIELFGVIDNIRVNHQNQIRIVDYKSSKHVYDDKQLAAPLQPFIYVMACKQLYPEYEIVDCMYDFVLLGEKQVLTQIDAWSKAAQMKLDRILEDIKHSTTDDMWVPRHSPLCYFCPYSITNPSANTNYRHNCRWYSLWTPQLQESKDPRRFAVAEKWNPNKLELVRRYTSFTF